MGLRQHLLQHLENTHDVIDINQFLLSMTDGLPLDGMKSILFEMSQERDGVAVIDGVLLLGGRSAGVQNDLTNTRIRAKITNKGLQELAEYKAEHRADILHDSLIETNKSIQKVNTISEQSYGSQKRLTEIALWIAGASAFIALCALLAAIWPKSDKSQVVILPQTDSILQSTGQKIDALTQKLQSLDSALKAAPKDSGRRP